MEMLERGQQHEQEMIDQVRHQNEKRQNKGRKRTSKVWDDFTKSTSEDGSEWAVCNRCEKKFDGSSKKGTTHLKNHSERCRRKRNNGDGDADKSIRAGHLTAAPVNVVIKEKSVVDLIKSSDVDSTELNSRKAEILQIYAKEKENLQRFISNLSSRFSLKIAWFPDWIVLTVFYIDDSWTMNKKIIEFVGYSDDWDPVPLLKEVLLDWRIHKELCSVIFEDVIEEYFKDFELLNSWVSKQGSLPFVGLPADVSNLAIYLMKFCYRILCKSETINKVNQCLCYVYKSPSNEGLFKGVPKRVDKLGVLEIAVGFKEEFCQLGKMDPHFEGINLTKEKWDEATVMCEHLRQLNDIIQSLAVREYSTMCFSIFCDTYTELLWWAKSIDPYVRKKAKIVLQKFVELYWNRCNLILAIVAVLDPRFKMDIVEKWYKEIYDSEADEQLENIRDYLTEALNKYAKGSKSEDATSSTSYKMLDAMGRPYPSSHGDDIDDSPKSQLRRYLCEPTLPRVKELNILAWWRAYSSIFPTLARMARDFLSIPTLLFCETEVRNEYESSSSMDVSDDDFVEALACLKHWM